MAAKEVSSLSQEDKVRILLVDDQPSRLISYEAILRELGHELVTASSGIDALEKVMKQEFAVILLDVSMPGMDGFETAALVHKHPRFEKTPIIFVTGFQVTELDLLRGYEVGAVDYVSVPVIPQILRSKVSVLAELYLKRKELQNLNRSLEIANAELAAANSSLQAEKARELEGLNRTLAAANAGLGLANTTLQAEIAERERLADALVHADRRKDEFLAMLAHELRNPLSPIQSAVQFMRVRDIDDPDLVWCLDVIGRQVEHLVHLVDDLLDVSRITQGQFKLNKEMLALDAVVTRAIETSRPAIDARKHELTVELPESPIQVTGDLTRLAQVVGNLLNNAAKYTEDGGSIHLSVRAQAQNGSEEAVICVRDNGLGIPSEILPMVFDLFTQGERTLDRAQGGLGIGLALVRQIVELHGGMVSAHSEGARKGSEFVVRLPALPASAGNEPCATQDSSLQGPSRRVLVVDDNVDAAKSLAMLLAALGNVVETAYDGLEAVEVARQFRPDVALLDLGMPRLDGYGAANRIRAEEWGSSVFLVALTGWGQEEVRSNTRKAGFDAHLVKPVEVERLIELMSSIPVSMGPAG